MTTYGYGALEVEVYANTAKVPAQVEKASKEAGEKGGKAAGSAWGKGFLELAAVAYGAQMFRKVVEAGETAEKINKATEAVIKATGSSAHVTAEQVGELANSIMKKTGVDDESVKSGENMLLTFRNVRNEAGKGNDIFTQATSALTDMTAAMHGGSVTQEGMRATAIGLGKALNDPVNGMSVLTRQGVTFTAQQKEQVKAMVKAGDTLGAQKLILGELNKEFSGAAAAYATPMSRLKTATTELAESMGTALLPVIGSVSTWLTNVGIPALMSFGHWLAQNKTWVVPLAGALASFVTTLYLIAKAFAVAQAAAELFGVSLELSLGPITLIIAGIIAVGVGLYLLWTRCRTFRVIVEDSFYAVRDAAMAVVHWITGPFLGAISAVINWVRANWYLIVGVLIAGPFGLAAALIYKYWGAIQHTVLTAVDAVIHFVERIKQILDIWHQTDSPSRRIWDFMWKYIVSLNVDSVKAVIRIIQDLVKAVTAAFDWLWANTVSRAIRGWQTIAGIFTSFGKAVAGIVSSTVGTIWNTWTGWLGKLGSFVLGIIGPVVSAFGQLGGSMISGLMGGISAAMRGIGGWLKKTIVDPIVSGVKGFFGIHSPSTVMAGVGENLVQGLFSGLAHDAGGMVKMIFGGWPEALMGLVSKGFAAITALPGKALAALGSAGGKIAGFFKGLFGGGGGSGVARWGGLMHQVLQMFGLDNLFSTFMTQMQTESGGNPNAINLWDSNAKAGIPSQGLMQVVPPTFAAYAGPFRSRGILDPLANIYAAVAYAVARYGANIAAVLGHGHGYALGGVVTEPITGFGHRTGEMYHFGERGPELISPLTGPGARMGQAQAIVINVYPRANQSEVEIAAAVSRNLGWAQATGAA